MKLIKKELNNIPINIYISEKYKTINIRIVFISKYIKENVTNHSLLTSILSNTSLKYNTKRKVANVLKDLYGANIYISSYCIYKTRITTFTLTMINEKYLDESIISKGINILKEFILHPNVSDGMFNEKVFLEEKELLKNEILKLYNNKKRYAFRQMIKTMCKDEIISISNLGTLEELEKITSKDIYNTYLDLINNSMKSIYMIGDINDISDKILKQFDFISQFKQNQIDFETILLENKKVEEVKKIKENGDVNQANLVIGYRTSIDIKNIDYDALQVFVTMFGGMYSSNLFRVVREENSLAYSINASSIGDAKIIIIDAGIDEKNYQLVIDLITSELNKYKEGIIDTDLLEVAKINMIQEIEESEDRPSYFLSSTIENEIIGLSNDLEISKNRISKVKVEDICRVSKDIVLDTIYMLAKEN